MVVLGAGVALWAGPSVALAEPAAGVALLATTGWAAYALWPRLRRPAADRFTERFDTLVLLRESFRQGVMGRQAVLSTLHGLEAEILGARRASMSLEEEEHLRTAPPREFRAWVDGRLAELEKAS